jgi:eukaryotic-like serine/threonine-protein kinase
VQLRDSLLAHRPMSAGSKLTTGALPEPVVVGRYALYEALAAGGTATVYLGRALGAGGFARTVVVKRLHPHLVSDPEFSSMILDEGHITAKIRHPNVVPVLDVVETGDELLLVLEYVHGAPLSQVIQNTRKLSGIPDHIVARIMLETLRGLQQAHTTKDDAGRPMGIVHRDVSPQNIMVGDDGVTRVIDFGIAKATGKIQATQGDSFKGKVGYMSPEQIRGKGVDARTDVWAAGVVMWEMLTGKRLFRGDSQVANAMLVLDTPILPPSAAGARTKVFDNVVMRALQRPLNARVASAQDMAAEIMQSARIAESEEVAQLVSAVCGDLLRTRDRSLRAILAAPQPSPASAIIRGGAAVAFPAAARANAEQPADASQSTPGAVFLAHHQQLLTVGAGLPNDGGGAQTHSGSFVDESRPRDLPDSDVARHLTTQISAHRRRALSAIALAASIIVGSAGLGAFFVYRARNSAAADSAARTGVAAIPATPVVPGSAAGAALLPTATAVVTATVATVRTGGPTALPILPTALPTTVKTATTARVGKPRVDCSKLSTGTPPPECLGL